MFVMARTYGPNIGPALNVGSYGWVFWAEFCRCVVNRQPVTIMRTDSQVRVIYNAGSLNEIVIK